MPPAAGKARDSPGRLAGLAVRVSGVTRVGVFCTAPCLDDWATPEGSGHPAFRSRKRGTAVEGARLDALQQVLWAKAMEGDLPAAAAVVRIIQTRCLVYGLAGRTPNTRPTEPRTVVTSPEGVPELRHSGHGAFLS